MVAMSLSCSPLRSAIVQAQTDLVEGYLEMAARMFASLREGESLDPVLLDMVC